MNEGENGENISHCARPGGDKLRRAGNEGKEVGPPAKSLIGQGNGC